jgi:DNA-binding NarL/FixJ family response regulator
MTSQPINILCVDDSPQLTAALMKFLALQPDMNPVGELNQADDLVAEAKRRQAHVVLLDLTMSGRNPIDALRSLTEADDQIRVIVYSGISDDEAVSDAIAAGAWGFVDKAQDPQHVLNTIRRVAKGEVVLPRRS